MKLAKLSLAAMVVAGLASSSFAADTLADMFKNGKAGGELRAWYFDREIDTEGAGADTDGSIFDIGGYLTYTTDSFMGFKAGATFQFVQDVTSIDDDTITFANEMRTNGAVLSEAYLAYSMKNTTVKVGRQYMATPLVAGSGSRMIKESFEGALLLNTDLPGTTLAAGYVSKFQSRGNGASKAGEFTETGIFPGAAAAYSFDGAYTVLAINKSIANLTLTGQYAVVKDVAATGDISVYHLEANYVLPMNGFKLGFDAVYRSSSTDSALSALNLEGNYMAGRVSVKDLAGFGASFAYGTSDSTDSLVAGMGNGADSLYTGTVIRGGANTYAADMDSYLLAATYDFAKVGVPGLTVLGQYAVAEQGTAMGGNDYTTYHLGTTYAFSGALKGFSTTLQFESQERERPGVNNDTTQDEIRFMANYKF